MPIIQIKDLPFIGSSYNFAGAQHGDVGVSMFLVEALPGKGAPLHLHKYDEIVLVQEGRSRFVIGDSIHEAVAGEILIVKAGTPHGFINAGEGVLRQIDIHVNATFEQQQLEPTEASRSAGLPL